MATVDITFVPPHKRDIGVVFQNYALFPHMSVGENVAFPLRARRLPKSHWPDKVRAALAMVDLGGYEGAASPSYPAASANAWRSRAP